MVNPKSVDLNKKTLRRLDNQQKKWVLILGGVMLAIFVILAVVCSIYLHNDKVYDLDQTKARTTNGLTAKDEVESPVELEPSDIAYECYIGSYIENISSFSVQNSTFTADMVVWFSWYGDGKDGPADTVRVLNGTMKDKKVLEEYHLYVDPEDESNVMEVEKGKEDEFIKKMGADPESEEGDTIRGNILNYQRIKFTATINKVFDITRIGLDNHTLEIDLEDSRDSTSIRYVKDIEEKSDLMSPGIKLSGYDITGNNTSIKNYTYKTSYSDMTIDNPAKSVFTRYIATIDIQRGLSSYFNLILPYLILFFIAMFSLLNKFTDRFRLGLITSTLFGVVTLQRTNNLVPAGNGELNLMSIISLVNLLALFLLVVVDFVSSRMFERYDGINDPHGAYFDKENLVEKPAPVSRSMDYIALVSVGVGYFIFNLALILACVL